MIEISEVRKTSEGVQFKLNKEEFVLYSLNNLKWATIHSKTKIGYLYLTTGEVKLAKGVNASSLSSAKPIGKVEKSDLETLMSKIKELGSYDFLLRHKTEVSLLKLDPKNIIENLLKF